MTYELLAGLATGNKIGLALAAGIFIAFALVSALLIPRSRPDFPSGRGLGVFALVSVVLFLGTMAAVFTLGKEEEHGGEAAAAVAETETQTESQPATTEAAAGGTKTIHVTGTEFKITLDEQPSGPGTYELVYRNAGKVDHDLVVEGPGVDDAKTPTIAGGEETTLTVTLEAGTYKLYCSVPGHEGAGMKTDVTVS